MFTLCFFSGDGVIAQADFEKAISDNVPLLSPVAGSLFAALGGSNGELTKDGLKSFYQTLDSDGEGDGGGEGGVRDAAGLRDGRVRCRQVERWESQS